MRFWEAKKYCGRYHHGKKPPASVDVTDMEGWEPAFERLPYLDYVYGVALHGRYYRLMRKVNEWSPEGMDFGNNRG